MRQGDFSEFSTLIYDPATATLVNNVVTRTPFANNTILPGRINPVAAKYASYFPEPNRPGTSANYFTNMLRPYDYDVILARVDHNISDANRVFGNVYYNKRREDRYNWALGAPNSPDGLINGFEITRGYDYRSNTGFIGGWTSVISQTSVLDVRGSRAWRIVRPGRDGFLFRRPQNHGRPRRSAADDVWQLQHDKPEFDHRISGDAAGGLGRGICQADGDHVVCTNNHDAAWRSLAEGRV
jgi:hypothetical protein